MHELSWLPNSLVKEGFEDDDLVTRLDESHERAQHSWK
jgi:hypothetical protein